MEGASQGFPGFEHQVNLGFTGTGKGGPHGQRGGKRVIASLPVINPHHIVPGHLRHRLERMQQFIQLSTPGVQGRPGQHIKRLLLPFGIFRDRQKPVQGLCIQHVSHDEREITSAKTQRGLVLEQFIKGGMHRGFAPPGGCAVNQVIMNKDKVMQQLQGGRRAVQVFYATIGVCPVGDHEQKRADTLPLATHKGLDGSPERLRQTRQRRLVELFSKPVKLPVHSCFHGFVHGGIKYHKAPPHAKL